MAAIPAPDRGAAASVGARLMLPACLGGAVAGISQTLLPSIPVSGAIALAVSIGLLVQARRHAARRQSAVATIAGVSSAFVVGGLAILALGRSIDLPRSDLGPPGLGSALQNAGAGLVLVLCLFTLGVGSAVLARRATVNARRVRIAGRVVAGCAALLVGLSCVRSLYRPDPDDAAYFAAIPVIGTLPAIKDDPSIEDDPRAAVDHRPPRATAHRDHTEQLPDVIVARSCRAMLVGEGVYACSFHVVQDAVVFDLRPLAEPGYHGPFSTPWPGVAPENDPMVVHYEPRHDLWLIEAGGRTLVAGNAADGQGQAHVRDLAHYLAPPRGWIVTAAVSLVLAAVALLRARGADAHRLAISSGQAGTVGSDGLILLDAGGTAQAPRGRRFLAERVTLFSRAQSSAGSAEVSLHVTDLIEGERQQLIDSADAESLAYTSTALVAALIGALPLAVAAVAGMLL